MKSFFQISICVGEPMLLKQTQLLFDLRVYGDIGLDEQVSEATKIMNATFFVAGIQKDKCYYIRSFPLLFGEKINGETQQLILTVQLMNRTQYLDLYPSQTRENLSVANANQSKHLESVESSQIVTKELKLAVYQYEYYDAESIYLQKIITLSMLLLSGLISLLTIWLLWYRLRRFGPRQRNMSNDLSHFEEYLPSCLLGKDSEQIGEICSICLIEFKDNDRIRKTHCNHLYHSDCLDSWCRDKLKCPLCRGCLSKKTLQDHKQELELDQHNYSQQSIGQESADPLEKQIKQVETKSLREDD